MCLSGTQLAVGKTFVTTQWRLHMLRQTLLLYALTTFTVAQVPPASKVAIPLHVSVDRTSAPQMIVRWKHDPDFEDSYIVLLRQRGSDPQFSVVGTVTPTGNDSLEFRTPMTEGVLYEVGVLNRFSRTINNQRVQFTAAGYACVGIDVPVAPFRGRVLLVVDSSVSAPLQSELTRFSEQLDREGWRVEQTIVPRTEQFNSNAVRQTKDSIRNWYNRGNPDEPATVFLIGRVAVPYSGLYYQGQFIPPPDGHNPDHRGAWPCDGYYGVLSESGWTDAIADTAGVVRQENRNLPGDGKFDNVFFPSPLEIRIGRLDFFNLPRLVPQNTSPFEAELALLREYFVRDLAYRTGARLYRRSGLIDDNFPTYPELFARSGWISFPPLVGAENVRAEKWFPTLDTSDRLLAYGCGAGSYTSAGGIGGVNDFATRRVNAAFTMLFGSYFGDWDSQNNLMRVALAQGALTCSWSGRPVWYLHPMAAGESIGDVAMMVQNFSPFQGQSVYVSSNAQGWIHVALLGDPTLRLRFDQSPAPPQSLSLRQEGRTILLNWAPPNMSADSIVGYYVYRTIPGRMEVALTSEPVTGTQYSDSYRIEGPVRYRVRTVARVRTPSGTVWELSPPVESTIVTTSVPEYDGARELTLDASPNPAGYEVQITLTTSLPDHVRVELVTLDGRTVRCLYDGYLADKYHLRFDTRELMPGVYILRARTSHRLASQPVVIVR